MSNDFIKGINDEALVHVADAQDDVEMKLQQYRDAYNDPDVDKDGLRDAANAALLAMTEWVDALYELNGVLTTAGSVMAEMMLGEYGSKKVN